MSIVMTVLYLMMSVVMVRVVVHRDVLWLVQVRVQRQIVVDAQVTVLVVMLVHMLHIVAIVHEFTVMRGIIVHSLEMWHFMMRLFNVVRCSVVSAALVMWGICRLFVGLFL